MLSSGANVIIWDKMLSSEASVIMVSSGANVIIWCYHVMLSSGMITLPFFVFPGNFTHSLKRNDAVFKMVTKLQQKKHPSTRPETNTQHLPPYQNAYFLISSYLWVKLTIKNILRFSWPYANSARIALCLPSNEFDTRFHQRTFCNRATWQLKCILKNQDFIFPKAREFLQQRWCDFIMNCLKFTEGEICGNYTLGCLPTTQSNG